LFAQTIARFLADADAATAAAAAATGDDVDAANATASTDTNDGTITVDDAVDDAASRAFHRLVATSIIIAFSLQLALFMSRVWRYSSVQRLHLQCN
jgi:hypothetical protein